MDPITIYSLASAGVGLASQLINRATQKKLNAEQMQFQYDYANYKNKLDIQNWQAQNNYNSPSAQMQRLEAAGLNPNLVYGSGGVTGESKSSIAPVMQGSYNPTTPYFDSASLIQAAFLPEQLQSQVALNQANAFKAYKDAGLSETQADRLSKLTPLEVEQQSKINLKIGEEIENQKLTNDEKRIFLENYDYYLELQLANMENQNELDIAQSNILRYTLAKVLPQESELRDNQIKIAAQQLKYLEENTKYLQNLVGISGKQLKNWAVTNIVLPAVNSTIDAVGTVSRFTNPAQRFYDITNINR